MANGERHLEQVLSGSAMLLFDGAMGSLLQAGGLITPGQNPDALVIDDPDAVAGIHRSFVKAGAQAVTSNTFRANRLMADNGCSIYDIYKAAFECAVAASPMYIAADIGPTGEMLEPYGDLCESEASAIFAEQVRAIDDIGFDIILLETMTDVSEAVIAVKAAKDNSSLPVFATMSFESGGRTMFGADPASAAERLVDAGADCVGMNCSVGPDEAVSIVRAMRAAVDVPIICQPNAGLPRFDNGSTVYDIAPDAFCAAMDDVVKAGATIVGGCCGTTPEFIEALARIL